MKYSKAVYYKTLFSGCILVDKGSISKNPETGLLTGTVAKTQGAYPKGALVTGYNRDFVNRTSPNNLGNYFIRNAALDV